LANGGHGKTPEELRFTKILKGIFCSSTRCLGVALRRRGGGRPAVLRPGQLMSELLPKENNHAFVKREKGFEGGEKHQIF
jgi:hypothetical protein